MKDTNEYSFTTDIPIELKQSTIQQVILFNEQLARLFG
jgi:hypothetical protein